MSSEASPRIDLFKSLIGGGAFGGSGDTQGSASDDLPPFAVYLFFNTSTEGGLFGALGESVGSSTHDAKSSIGGGAFGGSGDTQRSASDDPPPFAVYLSLNSSTEGGLFGGLGEGVGSSTHDAKSLLGGGAFGGSGDTQGFASDDPPPFAVYLSLNTSTEGGLFGSLGEGLGSSTDDANPNANIFFSSPRCGGSNGDRCAGRDLTWSTSKLFT